jgi:hypothetical protein
VCPGISVGDSPLGTKGGSTPDKSGSNSAYGGGQISVVSETDPGPVGSWPSISQQVPERQKGGHPQTERHPFLPQTAVLTSLPATPPCPSPGRMRRERVREGPNHPQTPRKVDRASIAASNIRPLAETSVRRPLRHRLRTKGGYPQTVLVPLNSMLDLSSLSPWLCPIRLSGPRCPFATFHFLAALYLHFLSSSILSFSASTSDHDLFNPISCQPQTGRRPLTSQHSGG